MMREGIVAGFLTVILLQAVSVASAAGNEQESMVERQIEIQWSAVPPNVAERVSGSLELTAGSIDRITILKGRGTVDGNDWELSADGSSCRIRANLRIPAIANKLKQTRRRVTEHAAILTVEANAGGFSLFPIDVRADTRIVMPDLGVLVTSAGDSITYADAHDAVVKAGKQTMLETLADEPTTTADAAKAMIRAPRQSDMVLGLDRNWESFWISPLADRVSLEERDPTQGDTPYRYGRSPGNHRHFYVGPVSSKKNRHGQLIPLAGTNMERSIEDNHLPISHIRYDVDGLRVDITSFAGTLRTPLTLASAAEEPALAVFYRAKVRNNGDSPKKVHFALQARDINIAANAPDEGGRLLSNEMSGLFQAIAKVKDTEPKDGLWTVELPPARETTYRLVMPYTPQSRSAIDAAMGLDFEQKHAEVRDYWNRRITDVMQLDVPEQQLNDDYKAGLIHILLRIYPGRYQATRSKPDYTYKPLAKDYGVWNGRFCPIASESMPMIHLLDLAGFEPSFVEACLQYYYNRQGDDGKMQVIYYDIETPWVLWGTAEHYKMTRNADWAKQLAPQIVKACDWIITKRRASYEDPEGTYGRGLFAGHTADDAPEGGGRNFMFNGYMYMGLKAAGELLVAIDNPAGNRVTEEASLYKQDILATLDKAMKLAPRIQLGDGFWYPATPPQHNIRGLANWIGFHSHGAHYLHDSELGPLHMVFAGVLDPDDPRVDPMLNVLSDIVFKKTGIAESQPAYSRHPSVLLRRGDVKNFQRAFYMLRYFQADREIGTWWEHKGGTGSPHKTHEEAWWLHQLRNMLVMEAGDDLKLCSGIPRRWLDEGKSVAFGNAVTRFGRVGMSMTSAVNSAQAVEARIRVSLRSGEPATEPRSLVLRVPHPNRAEIAGVRLNGEPWKDFDIATETVRMLLVDGDTVLRIEYGSDREHR